MTRLAMLAVGGALSFVAVLLLNVVLIEIWRELGFPDLKGGMIRVYGLMLLMLVIFGAVIFANFMERLLGDSAADLKERSSDFRAASKSEEQVDSVFGIEQMASAGSEFLTRIKTAVDNMNDIQKVSIVAALVMPFLFSREWRHLTNFYESRSDFDDYSALLGSWLVCAAVYYLWRPKTDIE